MLRAALDQKVYDETLFDALVDAVVKAKPSGAKGTYVKRIALSSTMGPGFKIDPASLGA